jgi:CP family cyanate transporter-like MFS transporter
MGLQSLTFYVVLAWLPAILQTSGYEASFSGWKLSLCQAKGILGSLVVPTLSGKKKDQRKILFGTYRNCRAHRPINPCTWASCYLGVSVRTCFRRHLWADSSFHCFAINRYGVCHRTFYDGVVYWLFYCGNRPFCFWGCFDVTQLWTYSILLLFVIAFIKLFVGLGAGKLGKAVK